MSDSDVEEVTGSPLPSYASVSRTKVTSTRSARKSLKKKKRKRKRDAGVAAAPLEYVVKKLHKRRLQPSNWKVNANHPNSDDGYQYFVEWVGYPHEDDFTWEPTQHVQNIGDKVGGDYFEKFQQQCEEEEEKKAAQQEEKKRVDVERKRTECQVLGIPEKVLSQWITQDATVRECSCLLDTCFTSLLSHRFVVTMMTHNTRFFLLPTALRCAHTFHHRCTIVLCTTLQLFFQGVLTNASLSFVALCRTTLTHSFHVAMLRLCKLSFVCSFYRGATYLSPPPPHSHNSISSSSLSHEQVLYEVQWKNHPANLTSFVTLEMLLYQHPDNYEYVARFMEGVTKAFSEGDGSQQ
jgi:hypothetical protein